MRCKDFSHGSKLRIRLSKQREFLPFVPRGRKSRSRYPERGREGRGKNQDAKSENKGQNDHAGSRIHDTLERFFIKGNSLVDRWHVPLTFILFFITPVGPRSSPINKQILTCTHRRIRSDTQYRFPISCGFSGQLLSSRVRITPC